MNLPEVFHFYFTGFVGMVVLLWSWQLLRNCLRKRRKKGDGKCPICQTEWKNEANVFQKRCGKCGFRLKLRHTTIISQ